MEEHYDIEGHQGQGAGEKEEADWEETERKEREEAGTGGRRNQPGQGDSAQGQREEQMAAAEGVVLREDAWQKLWQHQSECDRRSDDRR